MKFLGCLPRVVQQLYDIFYDTIPWSKGDAGRSYCLLSASIVVFAIGLSVVIAYTMFPLWVLFTWAMGHYLAVRMLAMDIWWCVQRLLWFLKLSFWPLMLLLSWFCIYWTWRQYSVLYTQISVFLKAKAGICRTWVENIMAWKPVESTQPPLGTDCEYIDETILGDRLSPRDRYFYTEDPSSIHRRRSTTPSERAKSEMDSGEGYQPLN